MRTIRSARSGRRFSDKCRGHFERPEGDGLMEASSVEASLGPAYQSSVSARWSGGDTPNVGGPETTILIRAFNEERWLPEVLKAIDAQSYRDFEVLLVDSGSVDRTRDIVAASGGRVVRLRSDDFTFGHSLNVGIHEARGRFIAILSAH